MFLLLDELWATSEPKSLGASQHPDEGVCQFGSLILTMSQSSDALLGHIHIADYLPFISNAKKIWCVASRRAALSSPRRVSWLSHCLLSSSHCAALSLSCHASWLSHCLLPSSHCATLLSSCCASLLSHRFSSSSCCATHTSSHHADWLLCCLLTRRPLVVSLSRHLVVSSSRRAALSLYRHVSWLSHHLSSSSLCATLLSSQHASWLLRCLSLRPPLVLSSHQPSFDLPSPCHSPSPTPSNTIKC
jgi:hypothetical protein